MGTPREALIARGRALTLQELDCREDHADQQLREILGPERFAQYMLDEYGDVWLNYVLQEVRKPPA